MDMRQVVFAEVWWIGTAVENPSEQQMPMPAELQTVKLHDESVYQLPGAITLGVETLTNPHRDDLLQYIFSMGSTPKSSWMLPPPACIMMTAPCE